MQNHFTGNKGLFTPRTRIKDDNKAGKCGAGFYERSFELAACETAVHAAQIDIEGIPALRPVRPSQIHINKQTNKRFEARNKQTVQFFHKR